MRPRTIQAPAKADWNPESNGLQCLPSYPSTGGSPCSPGSFVTSYDSLFVKRVVDSRFGTIQDARIDGSSAVYSSSSSKPRIEVSAMNSVIFYTADGATTGKEVGRRSVMDLRSSNAWSTFVRVSYREREFVGRLSARRGTRGGRRWRSGTLRRARSPSPATPSAGPSPSPASESISSSPRGSRHFPVPPPFPGRLALAAAPPPLLRPSHRIPPFALPAARTAPTTAAAWRRRLWTAACRCSGPRPPRGSRHWKGHGGGKFGDRRAETPWETAEEIQRKRAATASTTPPSCSGNVGREADVA